MWSQQEVVIGNINQSTDEDFNCAICYFNTRLQNRKKNGMDINQNVLWIYAHTQKNIVTSMLHHEWH